MDPLPTTQERLLSNNDAQLQSQETLTQKLKRIKRYTSCLLAYDCICFLYLVIESIVYINNVSVMWTYVSYAKSHSMRLCEVYYWINLMCYPVSISVYYLIIKHIN